MIKCDKYFKSYEGEGPFIGVKTLFFTFNENGEKILNLKENINDISQIYVNINYSISLQSLKILLLELNKVEDVIITFEISSEYINLVEYLQNKNINIMLNCKLQQNINQIKQFINTKTFIKIEIFNPSDNIDNIVLNNLTKMFDKVYLMPIFKKNVGEWMMRIFDVIPKNIRIMPPAQFHINID